MGSKARENAKATSLAFVLLDFQHAESEEERSVRDGVLTCSSSEKLAGPEPFIALKHMQATLYLIRSEIGSQCSFSRVQVLPKFTVRQPW